MKRSFKPLSVVVLIVFGFLIIPPPKQAKALLDTEPIRKAEIIIQSSKINATLTNFPVLLTQDSIPVEACDADGSAPAQNGGGDVRFTSDEEGNSRLPLEVVTFQTANDPGNCVVEMYVKVPSISSTSDTSIWMWYNTGTTDSQPASSSTYGSQNVWDNNYKAVWHFGEPSGSRYDSTANVNTLTDNNTVGSIAGKWGIAADLESDNSEYLNISDAAQTGLDITGDMTITAWVDMESIPANFPSYIVSKWDNANNCSYIFFPYSISGNPILKTSYSDNGGGGTHTYAGEASYTLNTGTWTKLSAVFDVSETTVTYYVNGIPITDTSIDTDTPTSIYNGDAPFEVGRSECCSDYFDGAIKGLEVSSVIRPAEWIAAQYENENAPGAFAVDQPPQDASSAPATSSVVKSSNENVTSSTTLQNDDVFSFLLNPNTEYILTSGIFATSTSGTPDIQIGFTVPDGVTMDIGYFAQGGSNRRAELLETPGAPSDRIPIPANTVAIIQAFGSVVTGQTGGTLNFQWSQATSNATSTTVKQGSFMAIAETTSE